MSESVSSKKTIDASKSTVKVAKPLSDSDKLKLLEGYKKYEDSSVWNSIPVGSHVRLLKKNGTFIRGGFVVAFYVADGKSYLLLENNKYNRNTPNYIKFKIKLDDVKRIFAKLDTSMPQTFSEPIQKTIAFEEPKINIQAEEIELLEKKIDLLEKIISQKDSELSSLRKRVGALENTTSGIMKYLRQQTR